MERNDGFADWFVDTVHRLDENSNKNTDAENVEDWVDRDGTDRIVVCSLKRQKWSNYDSTNKQVVEIPSETVPKFLIFQYIFQYAKTNTEYHNFNDQCE